MEIAIRSYLAASYLLECEPSSWDAIVILDSKMAVAEFVKQQSRRQLFLWFDDITSTSKGRRLPTTEDIKAALDFAADSERLVVSCRAGQSRSSATAFAIAFQRMGAQAALKLLDPKRHAPNELCIELAELVIDDPTFLPTIEKWLIDNNSYKLLDFLDEIVAEVDELEALGATNRIGKRNS